MSEEMTGSMINVAIVGSGFECKAMRDMFLVRGTQQPRHERHRCRRVRQRVEMHRYAQERGIYTARGPSESSRLQGLQMIIDLTGKPEVSAEIQRSKPNHAFHFIDHLQLRLLWSLRQSQGNGQISQLWPSSGERSEERSGNYWALFRSRCCGPLSDTNFRWICPYVQRETGKHSGIP